MKLCRHFANGLFSWILLPLLTLSSVTAADLHQLRGTIVDADTANPLAARLYIESSDRKRFHATSAAPNGIAVPYAVKRGIASIEVHTTLSAHPFSAKLPPGSYTLTAERGKEYLPATAKMVVAKDGTVKPAEVTLKLKRWTNMASRGWYSGETHVHRKVSELPTLLLAEDLNVALPLTAWVTDSRQAPSRANKNPDPVPPAELIKVDPTHVIWPINTEYEIFSIDGKGHTLGAVFILNHREPFTMTAPPVKPIAAEARRQGAILDLDKHNWPWSMMLMPAMGVQLFELTNNHMWRTRFMFGNFFPGYVAPPMKVEMKSGAFTERGWIDFGFQNYYALLNCGFDMKPTAGTASGVHPVPLGFGRVYVKIDGEFTYQKWIDGLAAGKSFVSTGPMLTAEMKRKGNTIEITGNFASGSPLGGLEVVVNGTVVQTIDPQPITTPAGANSFPFSTKVTLTSTSWIAVRGFESRQDKRPRFAHTAPLHFKVEGKPLRPKRAEVEYLIKRVADELVRHEGVLKPEAMSEYHEALKFYQELLKTAD